MTSLPEHEARKYFDSILEDFQKNPVVFHRPYSIYLAGPYSSSNPSLVARRSQLYRRMFEALSSAFAEDHVRIFSPIIYGEAALPYLPAELRDSNDYWLGLDLPLLRTFDLVLVLCAPGWDKSQGVFEEVRLDIFAHYF